MSLDTGRADPTSGHLSSPDRTHQPLASGSRWLALSGRLRLCCWSWPGCGTR